MALKEWFKYKDDYSDCITIEDLHFRVKVNALCICKSVNEAARVLGVTDAHLRDFKSQYGISTNTLKQMRDEYRSRI